VKDKISFKLRTAIVIRDGATCQYCGKKANHVKWDGFCYKAIEKETFWSDIYYFPFEPDHIIPKCQDGKTTLENLRLSCRRCNRQKGAKEKKIEVV